MIGAKNYKKSCLNLSKVTAKILSVLFFAGHGVYMVGSRRIVQWRTQATGELTSGAPRTSINNANISHVSAWVAKFLMLIVRVINYCSRIRILRFFFKIKKTRFYVFLK